MRTLIADSFVNPSIVEATTAVENSVSVGFPWWGFIIVGVILFIILAILFED